MLTLAGLPSPIVHPLCKNRVNLEDLELRFAQDSGNRLKILLGIFKHNQDISATGSALNKISDSRLEHLTSSVQVI